MNNTDILYEQASLHGVDDKHCIRCKHCYYGQFTETCHHPYLNDSEWPIVNSELVCDWYAKRSEND